MRRKVFKIIFGTVHQTGKPRFAQIACTCRGRLIEDGAMLHFCWRKPSAQVSQDTVS